MPRKCYVHKKFNAEHQDIIDKANQIIASYTMAITLRQLYYRYVARNWFPESWKDPVTGSTNNERSYDKLGKIISQARRAGLVDWSAITDRTRNVRKPPSWDTPADIVAVCSRTFAVDFWDNQPWYPEVWVEKDALVGLIEEACEPWKCAYFSCRGYTSDSEIWEAAQRIKRRAEAGQNPIVYHLGDHDPSGIDMSRDIKDRLNLFADGLVCEIEVKRIALTMSQIEEFNPPPNPAKSTDARYKEYRRVHGDQHPARRGRDGTDRRPGRVGRGRSPAGRGPPGAAGRLVGLGRHYRRTVRTPCRSSQTGSWWTWWAAISPARRRASWSAPWPRASPPRCRWPT